MTFHSMVKLSYSFCLCIVWMASLWHRIEKNGLVDTQYTTRNNGVVFIMHICNTRLRSFRNLTFVAVLVLEYEKCIFHITSYSHFLVVNLQKVLKQKKMACELICLKSHSRSPYWLAVLYEAQTIDAFRPERCWLRLWFGTKQMTILNLKL